MVKFLLCLAVLGFVWGVYQDYQRGNVLDSVKQSGNLISYHADDQSSSRDIYVFTDINCPYCRGFHKNIPKHNQAGLNIHYLFVGFLGPSSRDTARNILCSNDPKGALDKVKLERKDLEVKTGCEGILNQHIEWAKLLGVDSVPWIMNANGKRIRI